jgi:hypothetical protein
MFYLVTCLLIAAGAILVSWARASGAAGRVADLAQTFKGEA